MNHEINDHDFLANTGILIAAGRRILNIKEVTRCTATGISQSQLSRIENGNYPGLQAIILNRLLHHLKIPWSDLPPHSIVKYLIALAKYYSR